MQPAQLVLRYRIPGDVSGTNTVICDLSRDLSTVNRRLYRQGYTYGIQKIVFDAIVANTTVSVAAQTAGNTWMVHNAWAKGFAAWRQQRSDAMEALPGISGKWSDFKVKLDDSAASYLACEAADGGPMVADDWDFSEVFWDDDGVERSPVFHLIGGTDTTSSVGLVQAYHISRARPQANEPSIDTDASDSIYAKLLPMQDELSDLLIDDLEGDNDAPPYSITEMPGGDTVADEPWLQEVGISNISQGQQGRLDGFIAECGLVKLTALSTSNVDFSAVNSDTLVYIHLVPGPYRGVLAEGMGQ